MGVIAVIPARGGSKRIPGKNKKLLAGKPLIAHTILLAQQIQNIDQVIVSTDCEELAEIALKYGAQVPGLRPANIAEDSSNVIEAVLYLLQQLKNKNKSVESVILLQPTSPFRTLDTIRRAINMHFDTGQSVVSVNLANLKPSWYRQIDKNGNLIDAEIFNKQIVDSFDSTLYVLNGLIYVSTAANIIQNHSFYSEKTKALLIDNLNECVDIDTMYDWWLAEKIIEINNKENICHVS